MFPRGPRFVPEKVPDVPGPGAYNPNLEITEAYKRGAFLEKTDRFDKDKPSGVPGPGAYATEKTTGSKQPANGVKNATQVDKYATLQRKLEHLEGVHADSKKAHQAEVERLKLELSRCQKTNAEQSERLDKLKKQNDALDARLQESKKSQASQQSEIKDLRAKLRVAEHERNQLTAKQGDASEAQKALHVLETRRKDEVRQRDRTIADLERSLSMERKKREAAEAKAQEAKSKVDARIDEVRAQVSKLQDELNLAQSECLQKDAALGEAEDEQENLCQRLEQTTLLLSRVAAEYGRLASSTVHRSEHDKLKHEHASLQIRAARLERKLANSEAQVVELANLVRYTKENNMFLSTYLRDIEKEAALYAQLLQEWNSSSRCPISDERLEDDVRAAVFALQDDEKEALRICSATDRHFCDLYKEMVHDLVEAFSTSDSDLAEQRAATQQLQTQLSAATEARGRLDTELDALRKEHAMAQEDVTRLKTCLDELRASEEAAQQELEKRGAEMKAKIAETEKRVSVEKEAAQRLAVALQQAQLAEQALQAEVEQMSSELAQAEQYQEAYDQLLEEAGALVARNQLAEEEADRLSRFNAEILGHRNPAQRIMYVDRIRRELAETKQKLLLSTRDHEAAMADNEDLRNELDMYKSVMVPIDAKPRTAITRVGRAPLASQNMNVNAKRLMVQSQKGGKAGGKMGSSGEVEWVREGDMTIDELM
ncbi:hypothetical protein GLOTRDRAFT_137420 [Gloeophyllum trabeum ATCC 11539]|uniref:Hyaluronan-mediated motility receptor C-terminal domain-containing protein n=1 Tax=Gloeophyllum trabeum (strain ATCC 11539 / FP-39264 / Madison 617) TaxID=670483 RepID=S7QC78_GLOTA|nr:uncharacterized protein GLOTRDRAFT_137420 [Gloeophyllum trabeum ATCC 11539]EPQ56968.1 hypothetical protein GLOTRDRAFT_137420 [Gloeophyllum trabeum ATCC 11539]